VNEGVEMSWLEVLYGGIIIGVAIFLWKEYVRPHQVEAVE